MINGIVAIVGRPNVGKSTLFNRLTRSQTSIVDDLPGVTRDRIYGTAYYDRSRKNGFLLIDTGGFETEDFKFQPFSENIVWQQSTQAITEADLVLFLLDGKHGLHQHDLVLAQYLKEQGKDILFLVNKIDGGEKEAQAWEFYQLGMEKLFPISAAHSKGLGELLEAVAERLQAKSGLKTQLDSNEGCKIALVGRPNAGKSSILNRIIGEERSLVSSLAGTTRDSIDTAFLYNKKPYTLIDTAGIRRRSKVKEHLEVQSVIRSLQAINRADIVLLVIDALAGVTDQDARLINLAVDRGKPVMLLVNKWDLVPEKDTHTARNYTKNIHERILKDLAFIPLHFVSCLHNQRVHQIMAKVEAMLEQSQKKAPTAKINEALSRIVAQHTPQIMKKYSKRIKFYYATQVTSSPPTLVVMCNLADEIQASYERYMLKSFRRELGFNDVPLRLIFRGKKEANERKGAKAEQKRPPRSSALLR